MPAHSVVLNPPNVITLLRIAAVPVVCLLIIAGDPVLRWVAVVLFTLAAASDWVDGYLARRMKLVSPLGRMLDPIADKLLIGAVVVVLAWDRSFSGLDLIPAIAITLREIFVSGLREFLGPMNVTVPVTKLAKWKTTVQLVAIIIVLLEPLFFGLALISDLVLWLAGILTVITGIDYLAKSWRHLTGQAA